MDRRFFLRLTTAAPAAAALAQVPEVAAQVRGNEGAMANPAGTLRNRTGPRPGAIDDFAYEGKQRLPNPWVDPQKRASGTLTFGKHTNFQFCPHDGKIYGYGGDGYYPGSSTGGSSSVRFPRFALDANLKVIYDNYYPYWGVAGVRFPAGQDNCPFMWDSKRKCFWVAGGYCGPDDAANNIGTGVKYGVWRFWPDRPARTAWEEVVPKTDQAGAGPPPNAHTEGMSGVHVPSIDCLVWFQSGIRQLHWFKCSDLSHGSCDTGAHGTSAPAFPNVPVRAEGTEVLRHPNVYDSVNNEVIWQQYGTSENNDLNGVYATKLDKFPGALTTRQLRWFGPGLILHGQAPIWIRGRWLYWMMTPRGYVHDNNGYGLGIHAVNLDTLDYRYASMSQFEDRSSLKEHPKSTYLAYPINEGAYDPTRDSFVGTNGNVANADVFVYRYSPPSWTPATGNVKAITADSDGRPTKHLFDVRPSDYDRTNPHAVYRGGNGMMMVTGPWSTAAYARDFSTNGAMLFHNGGDGDYHGTEVYAFDFDTRRFYRLNEPSRAMTGHSVNGKTGATTDWKLAPSDPKYFHAFPLEAPEYYTQNLEHGPRVPEYGFGLLPEGTTPGVPHCYDGLVWIPGSIVGNQRGALLRPTSTFVYTQRSTSRAHYFDLDVFRWGRFSVNHVPGKALQSPKLQATAYDVAENKVYHQYGFLDLNTKKQHERNWSHIPYATASEFDPKRRLWIWSGGANAKSLAPAKLVAIPVDSSNDPVALKLVAESGSAIWPESVSFHGGLVYCAWLDCYFVYSQYNPDASVPNQVQTIWQIKPPDTNPLTNPWYVRQIKMSGDAILPNPSATGNYKRIQPIPPLKSLAIFPGDITGGRIYLYKPGAF